MIEKAHELREVRLRQMRGFVHDYAKSAIHSIILLNGGATVALLAFSTSILSTNLWDGSSREVANIIIIFAVGVLSATIAIITALTAQYKYYSEERDQIEYNLRSGRKQDGEASNVPIAEQKRWRLGYFCTFVLLLLSYVLFFFGTARFYLWFVEHLN